ncbi:BMP family ABC transporter substrate-binding protein [Brevibacterium jeotgali]|uniref:Basic membrane protein n=1 Tax=Brevibacterium jeotgali TaxID=1262550 RepID=A0A2H1L7H5_9MICO|nr:BMP family ABC transporter substrate-binding protein [Brevibacterium jeotgali]TWC02223.1 basic membrane protein [Brevibacterium jeotgali]SMY12725.1 Basic membrane protein [Brevibacterium jeotgali]
MRLGATGALLVLGMGASGCGGAVDEPTGIARTSACAVSAPAGFADAGMGEAVLDEVRTAANEGVVDTTGSQRVSTAAQTQAALERFAADGCTLSVLVGPGGAGALSQVASDNPDRAFLAVGSGTDAGLPDNALTVDFDLRESAYLAGYAAASATRTGAVAVSTAKGQFQGAELLAAFDDGVDARADEVEGDVTVVDGGAIDVRTLDDTTSAGVEWAESATAAGADVLVPFGSASPQGAAEHIGDLALAAEDATAEGGATAEGAAGAGDEGGNDPGTGEDPVGTSAEDEDLPILIWYGSDGSKTLPRPVRNQVVASIIPDVGLGMRAVLTAWPGDGQELEGLVRSAEPGAASDDGPAADSDDVRDAVPELVGGLEVRARRAVGDLDNAGVAVVASDGVLGSITGLGRALAEERERRDEEQDDADDE